MSRLPATSFDLTGMVRSIVISEEQKPMPKGQKTENQGRDVTPQNQASGCGHHGDRGALPAGTVLPYGTKLRDNDPRMNGRVLTLTGSRDQPRVYVCDRGGRYFQINRNRIHADGKPRKSGFSVVSLGSPEPVGVAYTATTAAVELGRCRTALCTAAELSMLLGNRPGQLDDVQATLDALRSQLRELGFAA